VLQAHILKVTMVKFGKRLRAWESFLQAKFYKNRLRGYTHFGQIYTKITNFGDLAPVSGKPTVLKPQPWC